MIYRLLADLVVIVHAAYASVVVFGLVVVLVGAWFGWAWVRNFWFRLVHFCMILVVAIKSVVGLSCPLTDLENDLRRAAGDATYVGSFIGHWVHELLFVDFPNWVLATSYCLFGLAVFAALLWVPPRWPWSGRSGGESAA